jgi:hypothetical protein
MAVVNQINLPVGDYANIPVDIFQADGTTPMPLDGAVLTFTLKRMRGDKVPLISKTLSITNALNGNALLQISEADTIGLEPGSYFYDVRVVLDGGGYAWTPIISQLVLTEHPNP